MKTIKLGTRRSLLAWAQSGWVAREIERLNPGLRVELVGIETRGDKILDVSLSKVEGKEFFVAELDDALRSEQVDLSVHSMKDLSLERPAEFVLAAIPRRENCRDVVIFSSGVLNKLRKKQTLRIGTSSPRRIENIPSFLESALPRFEEGATPQLELVEIRGNVNTRLSRVRELEDSPRHLDGVVLAFAGLIRLWADPNGRAELEKLLAGLRWMILPIRECPTAPAQGALAVECRKADPLVREALAKLHDVQTAEMVGMEREILAESGGGCHQKFGATALTSNTLGGLGTLLYIRGRKSNEMYIDELRWQTPAAPKAPAKTWDGSQARGQSEGREEQLPFSTAQLPDADGAIFVAHWRAVAKEWASSLANQRVWTSGTASWFKLALQGVWVEGCAEGLGFDFLLETLREPLLRLPAQDQWTILTHEQATSGWKSGRALATYRVPSRPVTDPEVRARLEQQLRSATHVFWSSGSQFDDMREYVPNNAHHACGPGKTAQSLRSRGLNPVIFPSVEEWRKWLQTAK